MLSQFLPHMSIARLKRGLRLFRKAFSGYKLQIVVLVVLGLLAGLLEGIGVNALIPLFSRFSGEDTVPEFDVISQFIVNGFEFVGISMTLPALLLFIVLLFVGKSLVLLVVEYIGTYIRKSYEYKARKKVFDSTLKANWLYLMKQKPGYLSTVIHTDTGKSADLLGNMSSIIMVISGICAYLFVAFNISQAITVAALAAGIVGSLLLKPLFYAARQVAQETTHTNKEVDRHINENIMGMKTIKTFSSEDKVSKTGSNMFARLFRLSVQSVMYRKYVTIFVEPISIIFIAGVFAFSYYQTAYGIGALAAIIYLIHRIFVYVRQLQSNLYSVNESIPYLEQLLLFQELAEKSQEEPKEKGEPFSFKKSIEFDNVHFSYGNREVLRGANLTIEKGSVVGLIGVSGGGKTTILDTLLRLITPSQGSVAVDGKNYNDIDLKEWRDRVATVPQDVFVYSDTVANNIRFFDESITLEEIQDAAEKAHMTEFIETLPDGFDTVLGADGITLSAGQRQRLAIARALVRKPELLLLDEATSALDRDSEIQIEKVLEDLRGSLTLCVVAHRLQTIRKADKLCVVDEGVIVEEGSPKDLLEKKDGYFARISNLLMS